MWVAFPAHTALQRRQIHMTDLGRSAGRRCARKGKPARQKSDKLGWRHSRCPVMLELHVFVLISVCPLTHQSIAGESLVSHMAGVEVEAEVCCTFGSTGSFSVFM